MILLVSSLPNRLYRRLCARNNISPCIDREQWHSSAQTNNRSVIRSGACLTTPLGSLSLMRTWKMTHIRTKRLSSATTFAHRKRRFSLATASSCGQAIIGENIMTCALQCQATHQPKEGLYGGALKVWPKKFGGTLFCLPPRRVATDAAEVDVQNLDVAQRLCPFCCRGRISCWQSSRSLSRIPCWQISSIHSDIRSGLPSTNRWRNMTPQVRGVCFVTERHDNITFNPFTMTKSI